MRERGEQPAAATFVLVEVAGAEDTVAQQGGEDPRDRALAGIWS
jgi:hypothetical protein